MIEGTADTSPEADIRSRPSGGRTATRRAGASTTAGVRVTGDTALVTRRDTTARLATGRERTGDATEDGPADDSRRATLPVGDDEPDDRGVDDRTGDVTGADGTAAAGPGPAASAATRSARVRLRSITAAATRSPPAVTAVAATGSAAVTPRTRRDTAFGLVDVRATEPGASVAAVAPIVTAGRDAPTTGPRSAAPVVPLTRRARDRVGCASATVVDARRRTAVTDSGAEMDDGATPAVRPTNGADTGDRRCTTEAAGRVAVVDVVTG
jgi:hypothetical protein